MSGAEGFRKCLHLVWATLCLSVCLMSCRVSKPVQYFDERLDTSKVQSYRIPDPVIEKGDVLNIVIYSDNPEATLIFNQAGTSGTDFVTMGVTEGGGTKSPAAKTNLSSAYQVDNQGRIRMHAIGELLAEGMTRQQLEKVIVSRIASLDVLRNPYCTVRFANFKVSILGDVFRPGTYTVPVEKITVLEALALAGEVSLSGRRDNLTLVRETMGKRSFAKLSLADPGIFESPYFYLKQNDVLIVNADERKITAADQQAFQFLNIMLSIVSILIVLVTTLIQ